MTTEENEKIALACLKDVLSLIHERRYKELNTVVDEIQYDELDELLEFIEERIYPYVIDGFYDGAEYYYHEADDHKHFVLDYPLTSCGVRIFGILFLEFAYTDKGLVKIIRTIDAD